MTSPEPVIGKPVNRIEDRRFLRGRGTFSDDVHGDGQLCAVVLRSHLAHGLLRSIDVEGALAVPGVHAVITAADIGPSVPRIPIRLFPLPVMEAFERPVIAEAKVRFVGEPVAVILADNPAIAEDGRDAIELDIKELPAVTERRRAVAGGPFLFEGHGSNVALEYTARQGDAEAAFAAAHYTRRETFYVQRHAAVPMEPRGLLAQWESGTGRMVVQGAAKAPFATRQILCQLMDLPLSSVDMIELDVGGGFGARGEFTHEDFLIPFAARLTGRPVKWIEDRRDHMMTSNHARDVECELEIACAKDGTITGLRGHALCDVGGIPDVRRGDHAAQCGDVHGRPLSHPQLPGHYRCAGDQQGPRRAPIAGRGVSRWISFANACSTSPPRILASIAWNSAAAISSPSTRCLTSCPRSTPRRSISELDSGNYQVTLDRCLAEIDWAANIALQGTLVDGWYRGLAIGCFVEGGAAGPKETARFRLEADGTVSLFVGSASLGQGLETVCAQIAADELGLPMDRLAVYHGSTTYLEEGFGSYHSRSVVMAGSAIRDAAGNLRQAIRAAAGRQLNCAPAEVEIGIGTAKGPSGRTVDWSQLAPLSANGEFLNNKHTYAFGAHAAHIAVDPGTGEIRLIDYVAVEDVGRIVNPATLHGQVIGSIVQGLGGTLLEHLVYDQAGQLLSASFADYLLPAPTDFANIRGISLENYPSPINPLGVKGAGEGGTIPVGGVIANALAAALASLEIEPCELPLSPPRVWKLITESVATGKSEPEPWMSPR